MWALTFVSRVVVLLALPAFCLSAVAIFGYLGGAMLGFGTPVALLGLIAAIALPPLCIFGPVQSRQAEIASSQRWLWVLSPILPFATLLVIMTSR
jgi:hypothetical protein